jgi:hypothetical protein
MLRRLLIVPALALLLTAFAGLSFAQLPMTRNICGVTAPPGWVVIRTFGNPMCPNYNPSFDNACTIQKL